MNSQLKKPMPDEARALGALAHVDKLISGGPISFSEAVNVLPLKNENDIRLNRLDQNIDAESNHDSYTKSFREINIAYDKISDELERLAKKDGEIEERQQEYYASLLLAQDRLISFALDLEIQELEDVKNKLNFWHKITVLEKSESDLLVTDRFVISIYEYFSKAKA
jgi:hypothetical protein